MYIHVYIYIHICIIYIYIYIYVYVYIYICIYWRPWVSEASPAKRKPLQAADVSGSNYFSET